MQMDASVVSQLPYKSDEKCCDTSEIQKNSSIFFVILTLCSPVACQDSLQTNHI